MVTERIMGSAAASGTDSEVPSQATEGSWRRVFQFDFTICCGGMW
jgi:hypothetical protein